MAFCPFGDGRLAVGWDVPAGIFPALFFVMVNQVLVRLWTRHLARAPLLGAGRLRPRCFASSQGSRSLTGQGPCTLMGYNPAIDGSYVQRRCGDVSVVMPVRPACVAEFDVRCVWGCFI